MNHTKLLGNSNAASKYRVSKQFDPDPYLPPELNLAAAILRRAVSDAKLLANGRTPHKDECFHYSTKELDQFFSSPWCDTLLCATGLTGIEFKEYAKI